MKSVSFEIYERISGSSRLNRLNLRLCVVSMVVSSDQYDDLTP
jgi:hypothetical protein